MELYTLMTLNHTLFQLGNWGMIGAWGTQGRLCYMLTHSSGEERGKRQRKGICGGTHTTFLSCFGKERNKVLTLSFEGSLDKEGYALN